MSWHPKDGGKQQDVKGGLNPRSWANIGPPSMARRAGPRYAAPRLLIYPDVFVTLLQVLANKYNGTWSQALESGETLARRSGPRDVTLGQRERERGIQRQRETRREKERQRETERERANPHQPVTTHRPSSSRKASPGRAPPPRRTSRSPRRRCAAGCAARRSRTPRRSTALPSTAAVAPRPRRRSRRRQRRLVAWSAGRRGQHRGAQAAQGALRLTLRCACLFSSLLSRSLLSYMISCTI